MQDYPSKSMLFPFNHLIAVDAAIPIPSNLTVASDLMDTPLVFNLSSGLMSTCLDPFNDKVGPEYLESLFDSASGILSNRTAFWLDKNIPEIQGTSNIPEDNMKSNPFYQLPFIPGDLPLADGTIPEYAFHNMNGAKVPHFNVHGIFGHQLSK